MPMRSILYSRFNHYEHHRTSDKFQEVINSLRTVLAPLFALYQVSGNPVTDDEDDDNEHSNSGLRALLRDVSFKVTPWHRNGDEQGNRWHYLFRLSQGSCLRNLLPGKHACWAGRSDRLHLHLL